MQAHLPKPLPTLSRLILLIDSSRLGEGGWVGGGVSSGNGSV